MRIGFDIKLCVVHDTDASTATLVAFAGEVEIPIEMVSLRPEHNNAADAIRLLCDSRYRYALDYDLVPIGDVAPPATVDP